MEHNLSTFEMNRSTDTMALVAHTRGFIETEAQTRRKLGADISLLDSYLMLLLQAMNDPNANETAVLGFEAGQELALLVRSVLGVGGEQHADHPFIPIARDFISHHPLTMKDVSDTARIYYLGLADAWREYAIGAAQKRFSEKHAASGYGSELLKEYHDSVATKLEIDAKLLDELLAHFYVRHYPVSMMMAFEQGLVSHLNYEMCSLDSENKVPAFRLWLDSGIGKL